MRQQAEQLMELRASSPITIPVTVSPPPANHDTESNFVLIIVEDADEIIAHNIEKVTEQLSIET